MESLLPCGVQDEQVEHNDHENKYVFEDRSMMVRTPPPSYHYAISTSRKNDDPWLARMSSLDETVSEMKRAVQDTQYMMKEIQNKFQKSTNEILYQPLSLPKKRLRTSKSFSSSSYSSPLDDAVTISNNENNIKKCFTPIIIDNDNDNEYNGKEEKEEQEEQGENDTDDLDRITQSLQQLIEQAQSSLKTKLAIRDRSYGNTLHRSNSCPQISSVFNSSKERRQSDTDTPSTPQLFDWNDQRERFFDSQSKLAQAMHELTTVCSQDNLNNTINNSNNLSLFQLPPSISSASSLVASSSSLQNQQKNSIVQHHYHEHHHYHHYHKQEQRQVQEKQHYQHQMSQILSYAWSSLRTISSNSTTVAAEAAARSSARLLNNIHMLNQQLNNNDMNKPLHIHPPKVNLTKTNLLRLMAYITLLIFSFMNQQQQQQYHQQNLSKKCITARRCIGQFVSHASDNLPISTWIQHSTLLVYIMTFL